MGLFTPKWMTDPARTALLDDEEKLKKAYEESGSAEVRQAAVARITKTGVHSTGYSLDKVNE